MDSTAKILIIEDEPKVASSIQQGMEENGFEAHVANDGPVGEHLAVQNDFDLVIIDINLPFKNGFEVCKVLREKKPTLPVLMLTALGGIDEKMTGFEVGADDYLVKPFDFRELMARVRALLKRGGEAKPANADSILKIADLEMNLDRKTVVRSGKSIDLTAKEFALLEYFIRNQGRVLSKVDIAEKVWDITFDTGTNVIEVYINFLRKKIDKDFTIKLIHTKPGMGYVLKVD